MKKQKRTTPPIGSEFKHRYRGELFVLRVVKTESGIGYELLGEIFRSPTAAAKSITGSHQCVNGWNFWNMNRPKKEKDV